MIINQTQRKAIVKCIGFTKAGYRKILKKNREQSLTCTERRIKDDAVVLGVAHKEFLDLDLEFLKNPNSVLYDVKGSMNNKIDEKL
ncbi:MAG: hypothetical protein ACI7YS_09460 [Flavobacterium sp.]